MAGSSPIRADSADGGYTEPMRLDEHVTRIAAAFNPRELPIVLVGGLAMGVYGLPRGTVDIDFLIRPEDADTAIGILEDLGYDLPGEKMEFSGGEVVIYRRTGIFRIDGTVSHSGRPLDHLPIDLLCLPGLTDGFFERATRIDHDECHYFLLAVNDYIELKRLRNSDQDQLDIKSLRERLG